MTSQTGKTFDWRRALVATLTSAMIGAGLVTGLAAPTAFAQPSPSADDNCTGDDCSKDDEAAVAAAAGCDADDKKCADKAATAAERKATMTAEQALTIVNNEYSLGDGGGQLSALIDDVMRLRSQGFKPSNANKLAIEDALEQRPNQTPLVEALKSTLAYQRKLQVQAEQSAQEQGPIAGPVPVIPGMSVPAG